MIRVPVRACSIAAAALLLLLTPLGASASPSPVHTTTYTLTGPLQACTLSGLPCISANYKNVAGSNTTLGVVYAVVHNTAGQTVLLTTASISPAAGGNVTAYLIVAGLDPGNYTASVFATDLNNIAISVSSSLQVKL